MSGLEADEDMMENGDKSVSMECDQSWIRYDMVI